MRIWLITEADQPVGHVVITRKYAMEYGGMVACLDDLYVRLASRNRGLSTRALIGILTFLKQQGIRTVSVEVGVANSPAQAVYRKAGFIALSNRELLALPLTSPTPPVGA